MSAAISSARPCARCGASATSTLPTPVELGSGLGGGLAAVAGDEHVDVAAQRLGRGDGLASRRLQRAVGVLGEQTEPPSDHPRFGLELGDELGDAADLDAGLALGGLGDLQHLEARRDVDAEVRGLLRRRAASSSPS